MRRLNYIFSILSLVLGALFALFMMVEDPLFNIGVAIGLVLVLNGAVRLYFLKEEQHR